MQDGYIFLHRKITGNGLWGDKPFSKGQAWIDLLLSASFKDHSFWVRDIEVKVKKGQVAISEVTMSKRWGWSRNKVRRFLSGLETKQQIEQQKSNVTTLITIVNWNDYQETKQKRNTKRTTDDTQSIQDNKETYSRVIDYLNRKTGKNFRTATESYCQLINARLKEGFTPDDFKTVIDNQCNAWIGTDQEQYLRPATLFQASKFDGYLQNTGKTQSTGAYY